jgi:hypothetical protein
LQYFRQNYPNFVPDYWWRAVYFETDGFRGNFAVTNSKQPVGNEKVLWRLWQKLLQESWTKFSPDRIIALLTMWCSTSESGESSESEVAGVEIPTAYPYQRAVMFLAMQQWRLKFCEECGHRFVKEKPSQRFCSDSCFAESRKAAKRGYWADHPEWLENRKRPKKSRRSHAKGKNLHQK